MVTPQPDAPEVPEVPDEQTPVESTEANEVPAIITDLVELANTTDDYDLLMSEFEKALNWAVENEVEEQYGEQLDIAQDKITELLESVQ